MTALPPFELECYFARWEFAAKYHMTASDAESMSVPELLAMAAPHDRAAYENLWLGYTETRGLPALRDVIASTYANRRADEILVTTGAEEAIYATLQTVLERSSHAIVVTPNYQSHETIAQSLCDVTGVPLNADDGWSLDIDRVAAAVRPNTRLMLINFPHNPTGAILSRERFDTLVGLCRRHGIYLFSDEVFRLLGPEGTEHLPQVADLYERGISLGVMSKAYGLPGLRIGWLASADREILRRIEHTKHYLSICNAGPSERLAIIALKARDRILARNCSIVTQNLQILDQFFAEHLELFEWTRPQGGCISYPRYLGSEGVERFTSDLVETAGVLLAPASIFQSNLGPTPTDRFRIGAGRRGIGEGLEAFCGYLKRRRA